MSKGKYREPRRRGFDDDMFSPQDAYSRPSRSYAPPPPRESSAAFGPEIEATVKWFNGEKGFGFVELADGSGDAFLHIAVLQAAGHDAVEPGAKLRVQVGQGQKGRQITAVLDVDQSSAAPAQPRPRTGAPAGRGGRPDPATAVEMTGTVKWFNTEKGFGFVAVDDGGKDIFIHISVLERAGLRTLAEGQHVTMQVVQGQKGREAIAVSV